NLNRAAPEVLAAMVDGLSLEAARAILSRGPFVELEQALDQPEFVLLDGAELPLRLSVDSDWFLAQARVQLDGTTRDYFRLINASGGGPDFRYVSQGIP
ncbi:MAG: general secretion pathway protein GspK, partial [Xanthomonadaceae bacterium]|nr:general secretion pathway protein GspK [Xanthomonadaceae bacterium]